MKSKLFPVNNFSLLSQNSIGGMEGVDYCLTYPLKLLSLALNINILQSQRVQTFISHIYQQNLTGYSNSSPSYKMSNLQACS